MISKNSPRVAVIGAGISGVLAAGHLLRAGVDVLVFERSAASGGIWYVSSTVAVLSDLLTAYHLRLYDEQIPLEPAYPSNIPSVVEYFQAGVASCKHNEELDPLKHAPPG